MFTEQGRALLSWLAAVPLTRSPAARRTVDAWLAAQLHVGQPPAKADRPASVTAAGLTFGLSGPPDTASASTLRLTVSVPAVS